MRFKNSFKLLLDNFGNVYKILIYRIIITIITLSLSAAILVPSLGMIFNSEQFIALKTTFSEFFTALLTFDSANLLPFHDRFENDFIALATLFTTKLGFMLAAVIGELFVYLLGRFLNGIGLFVLGGIINDKMSQYTETPFTSSYIRNLAKASLYQIAYVPLAALYDIATIILCYFLFFKLLVFLPVFLSLFFSVTVVLLLQATKLTYISGWMPAMIVDGLPLGRAMSFSFHIPPRQRSRMFSNYLILCYAILAGNVILGVCTMGSALIITLPSTYMVIICMQFVDYYTLKGRKYFTCYNQITTNENFGESDRFVDGDNYKNSDE